MDTRPAEKMGLVDGPEPLSPVTSDAPPPVSASIASPSAMPAPSVSTPLAAQQPPQLGQCVYVLSPWRRGRTVFTASQPSPQSNALLRMSHPTPVGLLRLAPYRPYFPPVPSRNPGTAVPRDFAPDFQYAHDFYNNTYPGGPGDYGTYAPGQEHVQQRDDTAAAQPNYEPMYPTAYPSQASLYSTYGQQQCWGHPATVSYSADADKNRTLAFYPSDRVAKVAASNEYVGDDGSSAGAPSGAGPGNVTKKSVRVKFMGPEAMYLTTKTLEMQPGRSSVDAADSASAFNVIDAPPEGNLQAYNNCAADEGLDMNEVIVQTSAEDDANQDPDDDHERVTFSSIEEALDSIDPASLATDETVPAGPPLADKTYLQVSAVSYQGLRMADEKQEEVIKAAKSLFSKRTRTLYHWLYPQTSKNKLKATVSAAWDTLAEMEKQFYVSQVLGRFGLQASSLMINPQLDGIKGLPTEMTCPSTLSAAAERSRAMPPMPVMPPADPVTGKLASAIEAQQAVDQLFASCADSESWTSYCGTSASSASSSMAATSLVTPLTAVPVAQSSRSAKSRSAFCGHSDRRKRSFSRMAESAAGPARLGAVSDQLDEEVSILKRMREAKLEAELEEDAELTSELEKFGRDMTQDSDRGATCRDGDDFWRRTPDPEDLFTHLEF